MLKFSVQLMKLVLVVSLIFCRFAKSEESSEDYLKNVMVELQGLKSAPSIVQIYPNVHHSSVGKRLSRFSPVSILSPNSMPAVVYHQDTPRVQAIGFTPKKIQPVDVMEAASSDQYYQQVPRPMVVSAPPKLESLGFTKNELAIMYKQALESGNTINLSLLKDAIDSGQSPSIVNNHLEFPTNPQQAYAYYFYPLKTFMNNLHDSHGYKTFNDLIPQHSTAVLDSQKQIVINPLFMAISSFVSMALLFMLGVIVLPRILGEFKSRVVHDEFLNLTKTVAEAIDNYNLTTSRPKTEFPEAIVGIKTRLGQRVKRKKPYRSSNDVKTLGQGSL